MTTRRLIGLHSMTLSQGTVARFTVSRGCVLHVGWSHGWATSTPAENARGTANFDPPRPTRRLVYRGYGVSLGRKIGPPPRWRDAGRRDDGAGHVNPPRRRFVAALHYRLKAAIARPVLFCRKSTRISMGRSDSPVVAYGPRGRGRNQRRRAGGPSRSRDHPSSLPAGPLAIDARFVSPYFSPYFLPFSSSFGCSAEASKARPLTRSSCLAMADFGSAAMAASMASRAPFLSDS